jgi:hypothetical protein
MAAVIQVDKKNCLSTTTGLATLALDDVDEGH